MKIIKKFNKKILYLIINNLSKNKLDNLSKKINQIKREKYPENKFRLYGDNSKAITEEKFNEILKFEIDERYILMFKIMFYMGLRVSEIVEIKLNDFNNWNLTINNIKMNRKETRIIPLRLRNEIKKYLNNNKNKIKEYIFYSNNPNRKIEHLSKDFIRKEFRTLVKNSETEKIYSKSKDGRKLNLISTHSLRYSFGVNFYKKCNCDIEKTRIALRHKDLRSTQTYIRTELKEVNDIMLNI